MDKRYISRIYKECLRIRARGEKKTRKMGKSQISNKQLGIREMIIKTTVKYHFMLFRLAKV